MNDETLDLWGTIAEWAARVLEGQERNKKYQEVKANGMSDQRADAYMDALRRGDEGWPASWFYKAVGLPAAEEVLQQSPTTFPQKTLQQVFDKSSWKQPEKENAWGTRDPLKPPYGKGF